PFCLHSTARVPTHIHPLSLHDALPISLHVRLPGDASWPFAPPSAQVEADLFGKCLRRVRFWRWPQEPSVLPSCPRQGTRFWVFRSEEHTSELQSRENLVCRLLLEKKNQ